jgi:signal transduction histidine kinase
MCHGLPHSDRMWLYEPIAEDKGIALLIHSPHELSVHGDRDLLIEAIANLVDNAVKFTPEIDRILRETITDPVGPEFMAPPSLSIAA